MRLQQACFLATLFFASAQASKAETLTFDDLTNAFTSVGSYHGLNFNNFDVNTTPNEYPSGYINGTVSPSTVIYNSFGTPASFSATSGTLTLNSFYLTAAINDGLTVTVTGSLAGVIEDTQVFNVSTYGPTLESLNWSNIDTVSFVSAGGTLDPTAGQHYDPGTQFVLDNVTINEAVAAAATPEPSSFALLGTGLLGAVGVFRKRFA